MIAMLINKFMILALHMDTGNLFPPPLSAKEEKKYVALKEAGDKKAKDILVERNLRLVAHIIKKYYMSNVDTDELISVGTVGLIKAVNTFSPDKGTRLATYAARCIDNEILMFFRGRKKTALDISFEEPIEHDSEGNPLTLMDIVSSEDDTLERICLKNDTKKLYRFIDEIPDAREKNIIIMRYGLDGKEPMTQHEIAVLYGISRSYVSRIETKCLKNLRKIFEEPDF